MIPEAAGAVSPVRIWRSLPALALAAAGMVFAYMSHRLGLWTAGSPDAGLMPFAASLMLAACALLCVVAPTVVTEPVAPDGGSRLSGYIAAGVILSVMPALVGSLTAFACAMWIVLRLGERLPMRRSALLGVAMAMATIGLFRYALGVPLPDPLLDWLSGL